MHALARALADALAAFGYNVTVDAVLEGRSGAVENIPLLVEADGAYLVYPAFDGFDLPRMQALRADLGADGIILLGNVAPTPGMIVWDNEEVARLVGATAALDAGLAVSPPSLAAPHATEVEELLPHAFQDLQVDDLFASLENITAEEVEHPTPALAQAFANLDFTGWDTPAVASPVAATHPVPNPHAPNPAATRGSSAVLASPGTRAAPTAQATPGFMDWDAAPAVDAPHRLPVRITPRQARAQAQERLFTVDRFELILQPVHLFDTECDILTAGSLNYRTEDARIEVNGTDRSIRLVDPFVVDPGAADLLPPDHDITVSERSLRVKSERALEVVTQGLHDMHTRIVEVPVSDGAELYSYTERRKVTPREDQVRITQLGVFLRPIWRMTGPNGAIDVDAMTGESVQQEMRSYPDAVILE